MIVMATDYAARIAAGLRRERAGLRYSQNRLASMAGLSVNTITRLENAQRSATVEQLLKLANALGVPATALLPDLAIDPTDTAQGAA